jgi:hypothetical protein
MSRNIADRRAAHRAVDFSQNPFIGDDCSVDDGFFEELLDFCPRTVALLQAYFDESERGNGLLCVAGYGFKSSQARKLTKEFRDVFGMYGGFHMKDLVSRTKGFEGISDPDRVRLVKEAVSIVKRRFSYGVAVTVNIDEYRRLAPRFIRGLRNPYPFLCHLAMTAMVKRAGDYDDPDPITYVFEAGHADQGEAELMVGQMNSSPELRKHYQYHGHAFLPKPDAVPLQAADLLAWEAAKFQHESVDATLNPRPIRLSLLSLFEPDTRRYEFAFCKGPALERTLKKYAALGIEQIREETEAKRVRAIEHERIREVRRGDGHDSES